MLQRLAIRYGLPFLGRALLFCSGIVCGSYNHEIFFALKERAYRNILVEERKEVVLESLVNYMEVQRGTR